MIHSLPYKITKPYHTRPSRCLAFVRHHTPIISFLSYPTGSRDKYVHKWNDKFIFCRSKQNNKHQAQYDYVTIMLFSFSHIVVACRLDDDVLTFRCICALTSLRLTIKLCVFIFSRVLYIQQQSFFSVHFFLAYQNYEMRFWSRYQHFFAVNHFSHDAASFREWIALLSLKQEDASVHSDCSPLDTLAHLPLSCLGVVAISAVVGEMQAVVEVCSTF